MRQIKYHPPCHQMVSHSPLQSLRLQFARSEERFGERGQREAGPNSAHQRREAVPWRNRGRRYHRRTTSGTGNSHPKRHGDHGPKTSRRGYSFALQVTRGHSFDKTSFPHAFYPLNFNSFLDIPPSSACCRTCSLGSSIRTPKWRT